MKRLIALGLAITIGFSTVCAVVLLESRNRDREQARKNAVNLVATLGSEVARNFEVYNLSLDAVVDGLNVQGLSQLTPKVRHMLLFDRAASAKDMGSIFVLDKAGKVVMDSRTESPDAESFANSDFFKVHVDVDSANAYVSAPWRQPNGEYVIAISRRVSDFKGDFLGVVAGTLRLSYFTAIFKKLDVDPQSSLMLAREDGAIITRAPQVTDILGANVARSAVFKRISESPAGSFEMTGGVDGVKRMYVYRRIGDLPLIVSYGQAVHAIYANWRNEAIIIGILMLALCATNVALIAFLAHALRRRAKAEHDYAVMATTDALTGLSNRRRFDDSIELEWRRAQRRQQPVSMLMIDADRFKSFNDKFGHQAGDFALKALAECISGAGRRAEDLSVRFGGEEFAVLLPETSMEDAIIVANSIQTRVASLRAMQSGRPDSTPTLSIGVACMVPFQGLEPRDLVKAADNALYKAKDSGRNRVVAVAPERGNLKVMAA